MQVQRRMSCLQGAGVETGFVDTFEYGVGGFGRKVERSQVQQQQEQLGLLQNKRWVFQE